jgi:DNA-binding response OmpR family regulator
MLPMSDTLLVIEDEALLGAELREEFACSGWDAVLATDLGEAAALLFERNLEPLVVLSDMSLPDGNALELLEKARARRMDLPHRLRRRARIGARAQARGL